MQINSAEVPIFKQGDYSDVYFVIVKGSVKIEQSYLRYKEDRDVPKIVIKSCYDGDQFGEVSHFTSNLKELQTLSSVGADMKEQMELKNRDNEIFEQKIDL